MIVSSKIWVSVSAAALLVTTGTAQANERPVRPVVTAPAAVMTVSPNQRYCIVNDVTGSRIPRKACASLADWQSRGIDPTTMARR